MMPVHGFDTDPPDGEKQGQSVDDPQESGDPEAGEETPEDEQVASDDADQSASLADDSRESAESEEQELTPTDEAAVGAPSAMEEDVLSEELDLPDVDAPPKEDLDIDALDVPEGKRGAEDFELDDDPMGEAYDLPDAEDAPPSPQDGIDLPEEGHEDVGRGGPHRLLVTANVLVVLAVIAMVSIVMWQRRTSEEVNSTDVPLAPTHRYITQRDTPERPIEDALVGLDMGESAVTAIKRSADTPGQCHVNVKLPDVYFNEDDLKPDAEAKTVSVIRAIFENVNDIDTVTVAAMYKFVLSPDAKPEPAVKVTAKRSQHMQSAYGEDTPAQSLKAFKTKYHEKLGGM